MRHKTLIVPGFHGSGEAHWQTWFETQLPDAQRVTGIDWEKPVIHEWAAAIGAAIDESSQPMWIVAHSFGCLASVTAAIERADKVAGAFLVAPADPWRFAPTGLVHDLPVNQRGESVANELQQHRFSFPSVVIASDNDPWVKLTGAAYWADIWGSRLIHLPQAGHINIDSGFGPWPYGLQVLRAMQAASTDAFVGRCS